MPRRLRIPVIVLLALAAAAGCGAAATTDAAPKPKQPPTTYKGRICKAPQGHRVTDCRLATHGSPDLSRNAFRKLFGQEVSITHRIRSLAPNPARGNARRWPLIDSLAQPMGEIEQTERGGLRLYDLGGNPYSVGTANVRGKGCAKSLHQQKHFFLLQAIALKARASGTQAFVDKAALDRTRPDGEQAYQAFVNQRGGGTGCGPSGKAIGKVAPLRNPNVGATAHARLGSGELNTVTEYDAKPEFGNVVYFSSNTTEVHAGGIARGMVRVGTPVARVDAFPYCDPNSDGTLIWRKYAIQTGVRRKLYGWIPGNCPARLEGVKPPR